MGKAQGGNVRSKNTGRGYGADKRCQRKVSSLKQSIRLHIAKCRNSELFSLHYTFKCRGSCNHLPAPTCMHGEVNDAIPKGFLSGGAIGVYKQQSLKGRLNLGGHAGE